MILASLTLAAMVATAPAGPFANLIHLHPHTNPDMRVTVTLVNQAHSFRDVKVEGHAYTIPSGQTLTVHAPVGTRIYAESPSAAYRRGDLMLEVSAASANQKIPVH